MIRINNRSKEFIGRHGNKLACLFLVVAILVVYTPAIKGGYIWDDDDHIIKNQHLRSLDGLKKIWFEVGATYQYYPMVYTVFWLEYHLWGLNPLGYHLINVLVHAANALILWAVLRRLKISGSFLIAAVFALHPVHVESVAWITEHKNTLSGFFYLCAILVCTRFFMLDVAPASNYSSEQPDLLKANSEKQRLRLYLCGLFLFICALLSKTVTCTLPAVLLLLLWWKRRRFRLNVFLLLVPFFLLSTLFGLTTIWVEKYLIGAMGKEWTMPFIDRFLVAGRALWFYAGKLIWPQKLTFIYPRWQINAAIWWQYIFPLAAITVFVALWILRRRLGRAPLVAVLFFAGTLFPALGFFNVYPQKFSFVADHFQYLASIGLIALGVSAAMRIFSRFNNGKKYLGFAFSSMVLVVLGLLTWRQAHVYQDQGTLYRDVIAKNPQSWMAHNNLGFFLQNQGKIDKAIDYYLEARHIKPDFKEVHKNLGSAFFLKGNTKEAIDHYLEALRIQPDYAGAHTNLGVALQKEGRVDEAIRHFKAALRIQPDAGVYSNLGNALFAKGDKKGAVKQYLEALRIQPDYADAHYNLANALEEEGRVDEAIDHYLKALSIQPDHADAHNNLGIALEKKGRVDEATDHYLKALKIRPDFEEAHTNLGIAFYLKGNIKGATYHFQEALRIKPDDVNAKNNLQKALMIHSKGNN